MGKELAQAGRVIKTLPASPELDEIKDGLREIQVTFKIPEEEIDRIARRASLQGRQEVEEEIPEIPTEIFSKLIINHPPYTPRSKTMKHTKDINRQPRRGF